MISVNKNVNQIPIIYTLWNNNRKKFKRPTVFYIQPSTVQRYNPIASRVYLPVLDICVLLWTPTRTSHADFYTD